MVDYTRQGRSQTFIPGGGPSGRQGWGAKQNFQNILVYLKII